ncbi:MAG: ADP-forming succinate--CoA ligase subunit beta [Candidatus Bathyarchaeota archaeon]|jgi:succinyl-CoA synthetase beta subunit|nr:ADP-forming succinate--CoA ligase subunit beta [Candidatus Bathyarchaeota archaeon A05DMB-3]MDH7606249.1 ADP-forming succinate--CoA ligase subunit beta [Candidatus Bathyarchaeota archaeon]
MKLLEYEAKKILAKYGIPTPRGDLATNTAQACEIAKNLKPPIAIKAQVPVAGRGKAGGILFVDSVAEVEKAAEKLFSVQIKGFPVRSLWIEERIYAEKELYFGVTVDRLNKGYVVIASAEGGMEIEEVAAKTPGKVIRFPLKAPYGFRPYHARQIAKRMGYTENQLSTLANIFYNLYKAGMYYDAELIEMNPLVETSDGNFLAVDARIIIDDNALFRHPEFKGRVLESELSPQEVEAARNDLAYVKLDGNIGVIGNGAGLVMATLDAIQLYGGKPANFLDVGGGAPSEKIAAALKIVFSDPAVKALFINILGGITRCDEVARGILKAKEKLGIKKPMVIRLVGTNEEEGKQILMEAGIPVLDSMEEAAHQVVEIVKGT